MRAFLVIPLVAGQLLTAGTATARPAGFEVQSLDGWGNNRAHPEWGRAGTPYPLVFDVERGRDHGMPSYNDLRRTYGSRQRRPSAPSPANRHKRSRPTRSSPGAELSDPDSLDFVRLRDRHGREVPLDSPAASTSATSGERRTPLAARLKTIYGDVSTVDALVGMVAEPRVPGSELGELRLWAWLYGRPASGDFAGDAYFSPRLAGFVLDLDQPTRRERDVLRLVAAGYTY